MDPELLKLAKADIQCSCPVSSPPWNLIVSQPCKHIIAVLDQLGVTTVEEYLAKVNPRQ
jgi:uncharacterized Zn finger protein